MARIFSLALTLAAAAGVAACGGSATTSARRPTPPVTESVSSATSATTAVPARHHRRRHHPAPDPGTLPQTDKLPSATTKRFHAEMAALWKAVRTGDPPVGRVAFFPERAYEQVKQIGDPAADWEDRLFADYQLDIRAAHALLGPHASGARLLAVRVPAAYAHWVAPGACYNGVGYYEVPNARVVYRQAGEERSFGIASMISWRGVWYVIHLGYVGALSVGGRVDDPTLGPGTSTPSSTC